MYFCPMEYHHLQSPRGRLYLFLVPIVILFSACSSSKYFERSAGRKMVKAFRSNEVLSRSFAGFYLYDPENDRVLADVNGHLHFTPASNTKVMTYFVSRRALGDSFPVVRYLDMDSVRYIKGCGYPLLPDKAFLEVLKAKKYVVDCTDSIRRFGSGWAWDDYPYYYQKEKDLLPLFDNALQLRCNGQAFQWGPRLPWMEVREDTTLPYRYSRAENANIFRYNPLHFYKADTVEIPFYTSQTMRKRVLLLLAQTIDRDCPDSWADAGILRYEMVDSVFIRLLHRSDNYIAEQLLLMSAFERTEEGTTAEIIRWGLDSVLRQMPDKIRWVDGSGLSRYNLNTPANLVWLWDRILEMDGIDKVKQLFPAAGISGTLAPHYSTLRDEEGRPYVFAKSGSLSNNYCLSGVLLTSHGRTLLFSYMINHFLEPSSMIKAQIEAQLREIYLKM